MRLAALFTLMVVVNLAFFAGLTVLVVWAIQAVLL